MLNNAILSAYCAGFAGYGQWRAPVWFVGIEEAGGDTESAVANRLNAWHERGRKDLEDAPTFCPAFGNNRWHGTAAVSQPTWAQLIRMLLVARGEPDTPKALLEYQRKLLGSTSGDVCLLELLPLPSPKVSTWNYAAWSTLQWLQSRESYQQMILSQRLELLRQRIDHYRPRVVVFYGDGQLKHWRHIMGPGTYPRPVANALISHERDDIAFFVMKHPADPRIRTHADDYFREIGRYFRREQRGRFPQPPVTVGHHRKTQALMAPVVAPLQDWSSAIGLFIINFGMLDLHVQDFLQSALTPAEFARFRDRHFQDRIERIKEHVDMADYPLEKKQAMAQFFVRLEPVRELRNHIAHGLLRMGLAEDQKTLMLTLSVPRHLDGSVSPETRHLTYQELLTAGTALTDLIKNFENLFGNWVVDAEVQPR